MDCPKGQEILKKSKKILGRKYLRFLNRFSKDFEPKATEKLDSEFSPFVD
jgi:hypothetical protein